MKLKSKILAVLSASAMISAIPISISCYGKSSDKTTSKYKEFVANLNKIENDLKDNTESLSAKQEIDTIIKNSEKLTPEEQDAIKKRAKPLLEVIAIKYTIKDLNAKSSAYKISNVGELEKKIAEIQLRIGKAQENLRNRLVLNLFTSTETVKKLYNDEANRLTAELKNIIPTTKYNNIAQLEEVLNPAKAHSNKLKAGVVKNALNDQIILAEQKIKDVKIAEKNRLLVDELTLKVNALLTLAHTTNLTSEHIEKLRNNHSNYVNISSKLTLTKQQKTDLDSSLSTINKLVNFKVLINKSQEYLKNESPIISEIDLKLSHLTADQVVAGTDLKQISQDTISKLTNFKTEITELNNVETKTNENLALLNSLNADLNVYDATTTEIKGKANSFTTTFIVVKYQQFVTKLDESKQVYLKFVDLKTQITNYLNANTTIDQSNHVAIETKINEFEKNINDNINNEFQSNHLNSLLIEAKTKIVKVKQDILNAQNLAKAQAILLRIKNTAEDQGLNIPSTITEDITSLTELIPSLSFNVVESQKIEKEFSLMQQILHNKELIKNGQSINNNNTQLEQTQLIQTLKDSHNWVQTLVAGQQTIKQYLETAVASAIELQEQFLAEIKIKNILDKSIEAIANNKATLLDLQNSLSQMNNLLPEVRPSEKSNIETSFKPVTDKIAELLQTQQTSSMVEQAVLFAQTANVAQLTDLKSRYDLALKAVETEPQANRQAFLTQLEPVKQKIRELETEKKNNEIVKSATDKLAHAHALTNNVDLSNIAQINSLLKEIKQVITQITFSTTIASKKTTELEKITAGFNVKKTYAELLELFQNVATTTLEFNPKTTAVKELLTKIDAEYKTTFITLDALNDQYKDKITLFETLKTQVIELNDASPSITLKTFDQFMIQVSALMAKNNQLDTPRANLINNLLEKTTIKIDFLKQKRKEINTQLDSFYAEFQNTDQTKIAHYNQIAINFEKLMNDLSDKEINDVRKPQLDNIKQIIKDIEQEIENIAIQNENNAKIATVESVNYVGTDFDFSTLNAAQFKNHTNLSLNWSTLPTNFRFLDASQHEIPKKIGTQTFQYKFVRIEDNKIHLLIRINEKRIVSNEKSVIILNKFADEGLDSRLTSSISQLAKLSLAGFENTAINNTTPNQVFNEIKYFAIDKKRDQIINKLAFLIFSGNSYTNLSLTNDSKFVIDRVEKTPQALNVTFRIVQTTSEGIFTSAPKTMPITTFESNVLDLQVKLDQIELIDFKQYEEAWAIHYHSSPTRNNNNPDYSNKLEYYTNVNKTAKFNKTGVSLTAKFHKIINNHIYVLVKITDLQTQSTYEKSFKINNEFVPLAANEEYSQIANSIKSVKISLPDNIDTSLLTPTQFLALIKNDDGSYKMDLFTFYKKDSNNQLVEIQIPQNAYWYIYSAKPENGKIRFNFNLNFESLNVKDPNEINGKSSLFQLEKDEIVVEGFKTDTQSAIQELSKLVFWTKDIDTTKAKFISIPSAFVGAKNVFETKASLEDQNQAGNILSSVNNLTLVKSDGTAYDTNKYNVAYTKIRIGTSNEFNKFALQILVKVSDKTNNDVFAEKWLTVVKSDLTQFTDLDEDATASNHMNGKNYAEYKFPAGQRREDITAYDFYNSVILPGLREGYLPGDKFKWFGGTFNTDQSTQNITLFVTGAVLIRRSDQEFDISLNYLGYTKVTQNGKTKYYKTKYDENRHIIMNNFKNVRDPQFNKRPYIWSTSRP